jgi:hypothetical protein
MLIPDIDTLAQALAASSSGDVAPDRAWALREIAEWHGVLPLLARGAARAETGSAEARTWLAAYERDAVALEAARRPEIVRALGRLDTAGVPALVLKGAHLAYSRYPSPHLRPHHDLDLLVLEADRARAARALIEAGYRLVPHVRGDLILAQMHFERDATRGVRIPIDLHWRALNPHPFRALIAFDESYRSAQPIPELGPGARGLTSVDALLLACAHLVAHHASGVRLIWLCDVDVLARQLDGREWDTFAERARRGRVGVVVSDVLRMSASILQTPITPALDRDLESGRARERLTAAYLRPHSRAGLLLLDLRAIDRWSDRVAYLKQHVWPDREYMRNRYDTRGAGLLWAYVRRAAGGAASWLSRPEQAGPPEDRAAAASRLSPRPGTSPSVEAGVRGGRG